MGFLITDFGAEEHAVHPDGDGAIAHAQLRFGTGLVMLGQYSERGWRGGDPPRPRASTISLYIVVATPTRTSPERWPPAPRSSLPG
jgi:uncharacterized glyoxalase superfamily protein PhnB